MASPSSRLATALHHALTAVGSASLGTGHSFGLMDLLRRYQAPSPAQMGLLMLRNRDQVEADLHQLTGRRYTLTYQNAKDGRRILVTPKSETGNP